MPKIMSDHDVRGQVHVLVDLAMSRRWREIWDGLAVETTSFEDVGLDETATDRTIWLTCQREEIVLITGNRNEEDDDSLQATIRELNDTSSLPVITLTNPRRIPHDGDYADRTVAKVLEYLMDLDHLMGTGRLFVP
jgi:predicted nuclease of predicted toxin-antitoxin system